MGFWALRSTALEFLFAMLAALHTFHSSHVRILRAPERGRRASGTAAATGRGLPFCILFVVCVVGPSRPSASMYVRAACMRVYLNKQINK